MKTINTFILTLFTLTLFGCGSDDAATSGGNSIYTATFSDSAVTSFSQTGGLAKTDMEKAMEIVIPSAYASNGAIRCVLGEDGVTFSIEAFGKTVNVDTACDKQIDLKIRRKLLESMENTKILMERSGGTDKTANGIRIQFNNVGSFWGTYSNVPSGTPDNGATGGIDESTCKDKYTFDQSAGTVVIAVDDTNLPGGATVEDCAYNETDSDGDGQKADDYQKTLAFRFKDGKVELDPDGTDFIDNGDYQRWCLDDNADNTCD